MSLLTCALGPDSAGTLLTRFIAATSRRLDAAVYQVGPAYCWLFTRAAARGVAVRLLLDAHGPGNRATAAAVSAAGGESRLIHGAARGHAKLLAGDGRRLAVGSGNLIWRDAPRSRSGRLPPAGSPLAGNREWWLLVEGARVLAAEATGWFETAWALSRPAPSGAAGRPSGAGPVPASPPPVAAPAPEVAPLEVQVDEAACRLLCGGSAVAGELAGRIQGARSRALAVIPYLTPRAEAVQRLLDGLDAAADRGVDVRLLLGGPESSPAAFEERWPRIPVASMGAGSTPGHAKGLVADDAVLVGSANWSAAGLGSNLEAALSVADPAAAGYFAASLMRDWEMALPVAPVRAVSGREWPGMLAPA